MSPAEQQPGGGAQPGWPNPYQQPGYPPPGHQHPGQPQQGYPPPGYQQPGQPGPGYQQPGPYQQPAAPWPQPGQAPGTPPGGGNRKARTAITIVAVTAVIAAAVITGAFLLGDDEGGSGPSGAGGGPPTDPATGESGTTGETGGGGEDDGGAGGGGRDPDDPRQNVLRAPDPVVAPDWQVQTIENRHNAFDVPPDWEVGGEEYMVGYEDSREGSGTEGDPLVAMAGVSTYMNDWCAESEYGVSWHAVAGTKGGQGATGTEEAAQNEARNWALAAYDQEERGRLRVSPPEPFESDHGITGHTVTATITDVPAREDDPCGGFDGKVVTVSYLDVNSDLATWVLVMDTGFEQELDDETIELMMNSLRPYPAEE